MLEHEGIVRTITFVAMIGIMVVLEHLFPRLTRTQPRSTRWLTNLGMVVVYTLALRLLVPLMAMEVAARTSARCWGLFNWLDWPSWLEVLLCVLLFDMLIYWQHVLSHRLPFLWRIHKVHHVDRDFDATTGVRFHPIEIILSLLYKLFWVVILGPAVLAVFLFEVLLSSSAIFNHSNVYIPEKWDAMLRRLIVTPDMHRVHHSVVVDETNSNYGFNISIWDRVFGSYLEQPAAGHESMTIGLIEHQDSSPSSIKWSLLLPFKSTSSNSSSNK